MMGWGVTAAASAGSMLSILLRSENHLGIWVWHELHAGKSLAALPSGFGWIFREKWLQYYGVASALCKPQTLNDASRNNAGDRADKKNDVHTHPTTRTHNL